jgi:cyclophilin family peptidyl-prolyl cis-trans isomerase
MILLVAALSGLAGGCANSDSAAASSPEHRADTGPERQEFNEVFADWTRMLGELRELELSFHTAPDSDRESLAKRYYNKLAEGYTLENDVLASATRAFSSAPDRNEDLKDFLVQVAMLLDGAECYEDALHVSQMLLDNDVQDIRLYQITADAAFACAEFELAAKYIRIVEKSKGLSEVNAQRFPLIEVYMKEWEREQALREAERAAGDLPRVVLVTVRGEIELELFENEAPNTVANFIKLVEDGSYDGLAFYEVTPRFAACAGCPLDDGTGSPGFMIRHEFSRRDRRRHFRGSLSTVSEGRWANGSQFHITLLPTPQLEGLCTVFGRVVRGMEVLAKLQRRGTDAMSSLNRPDHIIAARVLCKRAHAYQPDRIPDPTAEQRKRNAEFRQKMFSR